MEEMYKEEYGIFIPYLDVLTKDGDGITISAFDYSTTYDDAMKELKKLHDSVIQNGSVVEYMEIQEIRGSGKAIRHQQYFLKYKDADLSDLPYEERKAICHRFVESVDHFITNDFKYDGSMINSFNGCVYLWDGASEDFKPFSVGDNVIIDDGDSRGYIMETPGIAYSNICWDNNYLVMCESGDDCFLYGNRLKLDNGGKQ